MNNPFEMLVAITFLVVIGSIASSYFKSRENQKATGADAIQAADALRDQILALEDRIRVLERIVTDTSGGREDLRRQFRDLER